MAVCKPQHHLCHSAWEDQRCWCANICHMALPARASQCQYENSGTPAPLISHTLNEILALQNKSVQKLQLFLGRFINYGTMHLVHVRITPCTVST